MTTSKRQRCRDYDEKGFCTAGEFCPYEHSNAVIAPHPSLAVSQNQQMPAQHIQPSTVYNQQESRQNTFNNKRPKSHGDYQPRYNRNNPPGFNQNNGSTNSDMYSIPPPQITANGSVPLVLNQNPPNIPSLSQQQQPTRQPIAQIPGNRPRNLVSVMTASAISGNLTDDGRSCPIKRSFVSDINESPINTSESSTALLPTPPTIMPPQSSQSFMSQRPTSNPPLFTQPPPSQVQQNKSASPPNTSNSFAPNFAGMGQVKLSVQYLDHINSSLVVRKIPIEMNRVESLSQHFAKFGQLVDIQCGFEQNSDAALIIYANNQSALSAYKCPQPVFNNRFIRLFWLAHHLKVRNQKQLPGQQQSNIHQVRKFIFN